MKKLLMLGLVLVLSNCEIKMKEVQAEDEANGNCEWDSGYRKCLTIRSKVMVDGIEYHVYNSRSLDGGIAVINHTKEMLEVKLLRTQLQ